MPASSLREEAQATVSNKPGHRGEREVSRKTIARGMPGRSGVTVVTMLVCLFFYTRGCGCIERPAFPAPSDFKGERFMHSSGEFTPRECGVVFEIVSTSLRGAEATKQSILPLWPHGLLRFARNDGLKTGCLKSEVDM